jgi:metal-responsive CopG/Arc/MetJ family transcriptional regulator
MNSAKITISLNQELLNRLDVLVQSRVFSSRSQAIQTAVQEKIARVQKTRLAAQCARLDPKEEQALADMGLAADRDLWPEY